MSLVTSRQRVMVCLNHEEPDRVPFDCTMTVEACQALLDYLGIDADQDLSPNQWLEVRPPVSLLEELGIDVCYLDFGQPRGSPNFEFGMATYVDEWGITFRKVDQPSGDFYYEMVDHPLKCATLDDLEAFPWPNPEDPGWTEGLQERAQDLFEGTDFAIFLELPVSVFEHAYMLRGLEQWYIDLATDPEFAGSLMDKLCEIAIGVATAGLRAAGKYIQVVKVLDDMGSQRSMLISPQMFRKLVRPRLERLYHSIKGEFARHSPHAKLMLHTCGDVYPVIGDYIEMGIDILDPIQRNVAEMDQARLKREFGDRLCFHGGVDTQYVMPFGSPGDVAAEARQRIADLAPGGGYILAPVHNLQCDVPPENVVALRNATLKYGTYPLAL